MSKWWHVPDDAIEELVKSITSPYVDHPSSASRSSRRGVEAQNRVPRFTDDGDSLDRMLREEAHRSVADLPKPARRERGAWKVPDEQIEDYLQQVAAYNALEDGTQRGIAGVGNLTSQNPVSCPSVKTCHFDSRRNGNMCRSQEELASRPPWNTNSISNLFAPVGCGLDGKGNKVMKPGVTAFSKTPIYLSDGMDPSLSRVRVAVVGHPRYMGGR